MMLELGLSITTATIAGHYGDILNGLIVDESDADSVIDLDIPITSTRTLMVSLEDRERLADAVLRFADELVGTDF